MAGQYFQADNNRLFPYPFRFLLINHPSIRRYITLATEFAVKYTKYKQNKYRGLLKGEFPQVSSPEARELFIFVPQGMQILQYTT
jgi:hypothetical protein